MLDLGYLVAGINWQNFFFLPMGPLHAKTDVVLAHNEIAATSAFLILTATAIGVQYVVEQPISSLLFQPDFRLLNDPKHMWYAVKVTKALRVTIAMQSFAGDTNKRMQLVGTAPWLHTIQEVSQTLWPTVQKQQQKAKSLVTVHKGKFTGKSKELKASAAYTQQFGEAVALCAAGVSAAGVVQQLRGA